MKKLVALTLSVLMLAACGTMTPTELVLIPSVPGVALPDGFSNESDLPKTGELVEFVMDSDAWLQVASLAERLNVTGGETQQDFAIWKGTAGTTLYVQEMNGIWRYQQAVFPKCQQQNCTISETAGQVVIADLLGFDTTAFTSTTQEGNRLFEGADQWERTWEITLDGDGTILNAQGHIGTPYPRGQRDLVNSDMYVERLSRIDWHVRAPEQLEAPISSLWSYESAHGGDFNLFPNRSIQTSRTGYAVMRTNQGRLYAVPTIVGIDDVNVVWVIIGMENVEMQQY